MDNVFKNKNFLLLFQGKVVSNLAATLYSFALSFYILELTNNNSMIQGIYLGVCGIVFIVFSFIGGVLADRWNKVKIIYGSDFIKGIILLLCLIPLIITISNNDANAQVVLLFIIGIINNIIAAIFSPASSAIIPAIVKEEQLQQANSYFSISNNFETIFGVVLAGILYSVLSIDILFIVIGIAYIISGITELFIKAEHIPSQNNLTIKVMLNDFKDGFKYLWPQKSLLSLIFGILFINFFLTPYYGNAVPYLIRVYIAGNDYLFSEFISPELWSSIFMVAISIGGIVMSIIFSSMKPRTKYGNWIKFWLLFIGIIVSISSTAFYLFVLFNDRLSVFLIIMTIAMILVGASTVNVNIPISTILQQRIEKEKMAKVMSLINIGSQGLTPIASLVGGIIISTLGLGLLFVLCSVGFLLTAVIIGLNKSVSAL